MNWTTHTHLLCVAYWAYFPFLQKQNDCQYSFSTERLAFLMGKKKWKEIMLAELTRSWSRQTPSWRYSLGHGSTEHPGPGSSAPTDIIGHELTHLMVADHLSGDLFWSFARSLEDSCPDWCHCIISSAAGFQSWSSKACQITREESNGRNKCFREIPYPEGFGHWTLLEHGNVNSQNHWQLRWSFSSCHSRVEVAAKHFFFNGNMDISKGSQFHGKSSNHMLHNPNLSLKIKAFKNSTVNCH